MGENNIQNEYIRIADIPKLGDNRKLDSFIEMRGEVYLCRMIYSGTG
jgi:NAD-dependent DNA ligase